MSEDPYASGVYGAEWTLGLQNGSDPRFLLSVSTLKHLAAYSLEDYDNHTFTRQTFNALVSSFDLADTYLAAFQLAIESSGAQGVMYSCNEINGVPSDASQMLDQVKTLRKIVAGSLLLSLVVPRHFVYSFCPCAALSRSRYLSPSLRLFSPSHTRSYSLTFVHAHM